MLLGRASTSTAVSKESERTDLISEREFQEIFPDGFTVQTDVEENKEYWAFSKEKIKSLSSAEDTRNVKLSTWLEWQRTLQKTINVGHSKDSEILASLLQYSDAKRFEMPASTQNPTFNTQDIATQNFQPISPAKPKPKQKKTKAVSIKSPLKLTKSPGKRDGDIRALFSTATKSTKSYTKLINDLGIPSNGSIPTRLIDLLVDLSLENTNVEKKCYICQNVCDCKLLSDIRKHRAKPTYSLQFINDPILKLPDIDLIDDINAESLLACAKNEESLDNFNNHSEIMSPHYDYVHDQVMNNENLNRSNNFDLEFDFGSPEPNIELVKEKTPEKREIDNVVQKNTNNFVLEFDFDSTDNFDSTTGKIVNIKEESEKKFEIGDIEDIFAESSPEETSIKENNCVKKEENLDKPKETLGFFGLDSIDDIFADDDDIIEVNPPETAKDTSAHISIKTEEKTKSSNLVEKRTLVSEKPVSPSILSGRVRNIPTSPILCSQSRKFQLSTKKVKPSTSTPSSSARRQLIKPLDVETIQYKDKSTPRNSISDNKDKSMFTITQLVNMINKTENESTINQTNDFGRSSRNDVNNDEERSTSPILLTQADKKAKETDHLNNTKVATSQINKSVSLIILDSDSDASNDTEIYELNEEDIREVKKQEMPHLNKRDTVETVSPVNAKRKLQTDDDDFMTASPYFNKKQKLDENNPKPLTLQEKVLAALTSNKADSFSLSNNDRIVNFSISPKKTFSQKENKNPKLHLNGNKNLSDDEKESSRKNNIDMLQMFRRDSSVKSPRDKFKSLLNLNKMDNALKSQKRKITFDDSDDDFVDDNFRRKQKPVNGVESKPHTDHKARKRKKPKHNSFLDLEAELSDSASGSGDELSDDSAGSIAAFICDDAHDTQHVDMQAHYMRSVKSPVKGVFKIPELPKKFNNMEVFSQYVEEDNYEMDSFCVDSHIGLTQVNDISELELAEIVLEEERKRKKKTKSQSTTQQDNDDSPVVRRKNKNARQIQSDSDDSS